MTDAKTDECPDCEGRGNYGRGIIPPVGIPAEGWVGKIILCEMCDGSGTVPTDEETP